MSNIYDIRCPMIGNNGKNIIGHSPSIELPRDIVIAMQAQGILIVSAASDKRLKVATEKIARFFLWEMGFDSIQFLASEWTRIPGYSPPRYDQTDGSLRAFLWYDNSSEYYSASRWPIIGGCCFRRPVQHKPWRLDWIWLHPFARGKIKLDRAWPYFNKIFGHFYVTPPFSKAMYQFLQKQGFSQPKPSEEPKTPEDECNL
jgi:hypothetical protein